jgi:hypothetical protein
MLLFIPSERPVTYYDRCTELLGCTPDDICEYLLGCTDEAFERVISPLRPDIQRTILAYYTDRAYDHAMHMRKSHIEAAVIDSALFYARAKMREAVRVKPTTMTPWQFYLMCLEERLR